MLAPEYLARFLRGRQAMRDRWERFIVDLYKSEHIIAVSSACEGGPAHVGP